jgi:hypothetical protein
MKQIKNQAMGQGPDSLIRKDKLAGIKEKVFLTKNLKKTAPWLVPYFHKRYFCDDLYTYAYCLYADNERGKIPVRYGLTSHHRFEDDPDDPVKWGTFKKFLAADPPRNFEDVFFMVDVYPNDYHSLIPQFYHDQSPLMTAIEDLLKPSRGIILWHHQLENIFQIFFDPYQVENLRRGLGRQDPLYMEKLEGEKFNENLSLTDFIYNRMFYYRHITITPNFKGAFELYRWLKS